MSKVLIFWETISEAIMELFLTFLLVALAIIFILIIVLSIGWLAVNFKFNWLFAGYGIPLFIISAILVRTYVLYKDRTENRD